MKTYQLTKETSVSGYTNYVIRRKLWLIWPVWSMWEYIYSHDDPDRVDEIFQKLLAGAPTETTELLREGHEIQTLE